MTSRETKFVITAHLTPRGKLWSWHMLSNGRPVARSFDPFTRRAGALRSARTIANKMTDAKNVRVEIAR